MDHVIVAVPLLTETFILEIVGVTTRGGGAGGVGVGVGVGAT